MSAMLKDRMGADATPENGMYKIVKI